MRKMAIRRIATMPLWILALLVYRGGAYHITYFFKDGTVGVTKLSREVCSGAIFTKMKVNLFLTIPHRLVLTESSHFLVPRRESKDKIFRSQDFEDFWRFCVDFEPKLDCKSQPWQFNAFIFPLDSVFPDLKMPDSKIRWPLCAFCHRIDPNCTVLKQKCYMIVFSIFKGHWLHKLMVKKIDKSNL